MKKTKELTELTLEELQERKKKITALTIGLACVLLVACSILGYLAISKGTPSLVVVMLACLTTMLPGLILLLQVNREIESRH
ncbi:hypothetical protein [Sphingobacterium griseoflavum]|uniref:Redox-active disulfide protein 2 n=1 Tax=Sphingobacterium griseoflavum TaxID=1474952 RepID=A0ABQ3HT32_9SPHI|nr:hypothetical protein [Sphingobacterium griseoflavum]GHE23375.1 hypothetical protein GCM10017764_03430 [Sphingobacterium griseoflavum]